MSPNRHYMITNSYFRTFFLLVLACGAIVLAGPGYAASPVRIAVSKTPLSLPLYVAQEQGFFKRHGVDVVFQDCLGGVRCFKLLLENQADMATSSELPIVFNAFERQDFSLLATFVNNKKDMRFIANTSKLGQHLEHIKGARVGVVRRSSSQYFLDIFLLYNNIDPALVEQIELGPEELGPALKEGKVDAIAAWEPWGFHALKGNPQAREIDVPNLYNQTFNLAGLDAYINSNPKQTRAVLRALADALAYLQAHPDYSMALLEKRLGLEKAFLQQAWPNYIWGLSLRQTLITTLDAQAKWAKQEGHVPANLPIPNLLKVINHKPLYSIAPNAVDYMN